MRSWEYSLWVTNIPLQYTIHWFSTSTTKSRFTSFTYLHLWVPSPSKQECADSRFVYSYLVQEFMSDKENEEFEFEKLVWVILSSLLSDLIALETTDFRLKIVWSLVWCWWTKNSPVDACMQSRTVWNTQIIYQYWKSDVNWRQSCWVLSADLSLWLVFKALVQQGEIIK